MDTDNLIHGLLDMGMSEREAKVYLAMLTRHHLPLSDLQRLSGLQHSKVSEIVGNLVRKGFCKERKVGRKRFFDAFDPRESFSAPLSMMENQVTRGKKLSRTLSKLYAKAEKADRPLEYVEILHGCNNIHDQYCRFIRDAGEEILAFVRPPYACATEKAIKEQRLSYDAFLERGGRLQWVFELNAPGQKERIRELKPLAAKGARIGFMDQLPLKMMIFDRREVLVMQEKALSGTGDMTMARMKQGAIAEAFRVLFKFFFAHSLSYDAFMQKEKKTADKKSAHSRGAKRTRSKDDRRAVESKH